MSAAAFPRIEVNGRPASVDDLRHLVHTNYGHFTAFRVEDGGVRGLDLHLDRMLRATRALFGTELDRELVRGHLRRAVGGEKQELSVRVNVFSRSLDRERLDRPVQADVLVMVAPATRRATVPLRVKSFRYLRDLAAVKHVGTFPLFHYRRLARQAGFDDALFVDENGAIAEGSIWNIGFVDRDGGIIWPEAAQLEGVSMQLLKAGLAEEGVRCVERTVRLSDLAGFRAAFFTNTSVPAWPIASIDDHRFGADAGFLERLAHCHDSRPLQRL